PRALRQLSQRHGDPRADARARRRPAAGALEDDAAGGGDANLSRAPGVLRQAAEGGRVRSGQLAGARPRRGARRRPDRGQRPPDDDCRRLQGVGGPDLGLPGQPDVDGRRSQRRLHRAAAAGVEPRRLPRQLREVSCGDSRADAGDAEPELLHARAGGRLRRAAAVQRVRSSGTLVLFGPSPISRARVSTVSSKTNTTSPSRALLPWTMSLRLLTGERGTPSTSRRKVWSQKFTG